MNTNIGYIYIRNHSSYDVNDVYKMGKTINIPERDTQYATGEVIRGCFEVVYEVPIRQMGNIERLLKYEFRKFNVMYNGGTEFFKKHIITLIEQFLIKICIKYKKLTKDEISKLIRHYRVKKLIKNINILKLKKINEQNIKLELNNEVYNPRKYQEDIIKKSYDYFQLNKKGLLIIPCGVGKTLISLWITYKLNLSTVLIGVPNILLIKQWEEVICTLFNNVSYLLVYGDITIDKIRAFLENNQQKCIIITTYSSSHKVCSATKSIKFKFSMKILDEVHHLTTNNMTLANKTKTYIQMLNILSIKQISLTATVKHFENSENIVNANNMVSNDNVKYFGEIIDKRCLLWAINENIICDYVIQTIITIHVQLEEQLVKFNIIEENDKRLFLCSYASLKSIISGHSHHLLIYSNNKENSLKIIQYIKRLLDNKYFNMPDLYCSNYHSEMKSKDQKEIINKFKNAKFGIIACVFCLGEGWDFPLLDGVVFAENMTSNIRIVQSALRASRKNNNREPNKITKIILPILNDKWLENNENSDLKKVKEVIHQMSLEDETITQKMKIFRINIEKQKYKQYDDIKTTADFGEYDEELTQKLKLKTINRATYDITYEKAKKIIASNNIKSKESYYELCDIDNRLSKEPEIKFGYQFTNWIDYLSIAYIYYDLETCKNKVGDYLMLNNGLWTDYYNLKNLREIITINNKKKKLLYST